jgi:isopentenyl-diphosphate delta-isomerase
VTRIPAWVDGRLTPVDKLEAHLLGLRHKAVSVFAVDGEDVLIQRRAAGKYHTPGLWTNTCCTHPYWGEAPFACARRRRAEELGIRGVALEPRGTIEYRADVGDGLLEHEVVDVFLAPLRRRPTLWPDPAEVLAVRWVSRAELSAVVRESPDLFTPWLAICLQEHSALIFGESA